MRMRTAATVLTAAACLAVPATASAHHGTGHHHRWHGRGGDVCTAVRSATPPAKLTADQVAAAKAACDTRDAAFAKAKADKDPAEFRAAAKSFKDALKAAGIKKAGCNGHHGRHHSRHHR